MSYCWLVESCNAPVPRRAGNATLMQDNVLRPCLFWGEPRVLACIVDALLSCLARPHLCTARLLCSCRLAVSALVSMGSGALGGRTSTSPRKGGTAQALKRRRTASGELPPPPPAQRVRPSPAAQLPAALPLPPVQPPAQHQQPPQQQPLSEPLALLQRLLGPSAPPPAPAAAAAAPPMQPRPQLQQQQLAAGMDTETLLRLLLQDSAAPAAPAAPAPGAAALALHAAPVAPSAAAPAHLAATAPVPLPAAPAMLTGAEAAAAAHSSSPGTTTESLMSLLGFLAHGGAKQGQAPSPRGQHHHY